MAKSIAMKNPKTGQTVDGFYGYSWTTLIFGVFPPLFRSDFLTFIGLFVISGILAATTGVGAIVAIIIWSFMYNKYYTLNLIKKGFKFNGTLEENKVAAMALNLELNSFNSFKYGDDSTEESQNAK